MFKNLPPGTCAQSPAQDREIAVSMGPMRVTLRLERLGGCVKMRRQVGARPHLRREPLRPIELAIQRVHRVPAVRAVAQIASLWQ